LTRGQQPRGVLMQIFVYSKDSDTQTLEDAFATYARPSYGEEYTPIEVENTLVPMLQGDAVLPGNVQKSVFVVDTMADYWLYLSVMNSDDPIVSAILEHIRPLSDVDACDDMMSEDLETSEEMDESSLYDVVMLEVGTSKINVIKAVRGLTSLGLVEAKDIVEKAPDAIVLMNVSLDIAEAAGSLGLGVVNKGSSEIKRELG